MALVVDFGGVLTTNIWIAFAAFCESEGLAPETVRELFRGDAEALRLLRGLETGELADESSSGGSARCSASRARGPDRAHVRRAAARRGMVDAVRAARRRRRATGLISNSWGLGIYDGRRSTSSTPP